jgi:hypothetical protein
MASIDSILDRRALLTGVAAVAFAAWTADAGVAAETLIATLIAQAQSHPTISARIDFISHALLGHRYQADTLIGGPRKAEVFVTRDDRFDCVTFCETVLAAARAHDLPSFEAALRAIRYRGGVVEWHTRNHDFAAWCERNVADGFCKPVTIGAAAEIKKTLTAPSALGRRNYVIAGIPSKALLANKNALKRGDIVGFVSHRSWLDYFHTGFATFDDRGELMLRNASLSHRKVVDQTMKGFLATNGVRYVTVLRPQELDKPA